MLPGYFAFHCLFWHTYTTVCSSSAGVAMLVGCDPQLRIKDFTHHEGVPPQNVEHIGRGLN